MVILNKFSQLSVLHIVDLDRHSRYPEPNIHIIQLIIHYRFVSEQFLSN